MAAEPRAESGISVSDWYVFRPPFSNISSIMSVLLRLEWSQVLAYYVRPAAPGVESSISMCLIRMSYERLVSALIEPY